MDNKKNKYEKLKQQREKAQSNIDRRKIKVAPNTRRGEVIRAQRMVTSDVMQRSSQHILGNPVNKSIYNGNDGEQITPTAIKKMRPDPEAVRIIPLGGQGEIGIGKNTNLIEYKDEMVIIDMGTLFANEDYPGVSHMVADISYVKNKIKNLKGILFTHAHLDHIGGCRTLLPQLPGVPIYGSEFTIAMIKKQMDEVNLDFEINYNVVDPFLHQDIKIGKYLSFEFIHALHSIPGSVFINVRTPNGNILHSGDWRFEKDPVDKPFDMPRIAEISQKEGIEVFMNESTNVEVPGSYTTTEQEIGENIGKIMNFYDNNRIIVSCFSSQIERMQFILEQAHKHGRKVAFAGYSMINNIETALRTKKIKIPKDTVIKIENAVHLPDGQVTIICTGSQGELNAVLNRMISGSHRFIKIKHTDVVVFSSNPIPGNEPKVALTVDGLLREGAQVIQNKKANKLNLGLIHMSGHACYDDHVTMIKAVNPRSYIPIYGQFYMLQRSAELAHEVCGINKNNIFVCDNGDVVELRKDHSTRKHGRIHCGTLIYDRGNDKVPMNEAVIKDRLHISTQGILMVVMTVNSKTGRLSKAPDIISRAFIYLKDNEELMARIRHYLKLKIEKCDLKNTDSKVLKNEIKDDVSHILFDATGKSPVVIPVINQF